MNLIVSPVADFLIAPQVGEKLALLVHGVQVFFPIRNHPWRPALAFAVEVVLRRFQVDDGPFDVEHSVEGPEFFPKDVRHIGHFERFVLEGVPLHLFGKGNELGEVFFLEKPKGEGFFSCAAVGTSIFQ